MSKSRRFLIEYDIYVPSASQTADVKIAEKLLAVRQRLVDYFGGLTDTRLRNEGLWKVGAVTVRDEVVVWRALSDKGEAGDELMREVKQVLERLLAQDVILIVRREVEVLE